MVASCKNGCTLLNLTENTLLCNFFFLYVTLIFQDH